MNVCVPGIGREKQHCELWGVHRNVAGHLESWNLHSFKTRVSFMRTLIKEAVYPRTHPAVMERSGLPAGL